MKERGLRKTLTGTVISDKMDKTVVVQVDRLVKHHTYKSTYGDALNIKLMMKIMIAKKAIEW